MEWCFWIKISSDEGQAMMFCRFPQRMSREDCEHELNCEFSQYQDAGFSVDWSAIDPGGMQEIYDMNEAQFRAIGAGIL